jgi:hypothetical protein
MGRLVVRRRGLLFGLMGLMRRHPYWVVWLAALAVVASERGW